MDVLSVVASLGAALAAGLVVGFEREQHAATEPGEQRFGGARTFPLVALAGALAALVAPTLGAAFGAVALGGVVLLMGAHHVLRAPVAGGKGITTEVAGVVVFLLGALAAVDAVFATPREKLVGVMGLAVVVALLLSIKPKLHDLARRITADDVWAGLQLGVVALVVVPLLPDRDMGPYDAVNPFRTGTMVLLIAAISLAGYAASRLLGAGRGLAVTGFVGGLASSTAVTFAMARRARDEDALRRSAALAVVVASTIVYARVVVEVAVVDPALVSAVVVPMGAMALAGATCVALLWRGARNEAKATAELALKNPFELKSAVVFGAIYAVVQVATEAARSEIGPAGLYVAGALAGATDVDAITLSVADLARDGLPHDAALWTILIANASNLVVKAGVALVLGGARFGRVVALAYVAMIAAGVVGVLLA